MSEPVTFNKARESILAFEGQPAQQMAIADDYVSRSQEYIRNRNFSDEDYLKSQDRIEEGGYKLRASVIFDNADLILAPLGKEKAQSVWDAYKNGNKDELSDEEISYYDQLENISREFPATWGERMSLRVVEGGLTRGVKGKTFGGVRISRRANNKAEATITQSQEGTPIGDRTFMLDTDVEGKLESLNSQLKEQQNNLARIEEESSRLDPSMTSQANVVKSMAEEDIEETQNLIERYSGRDGERNWLSDQTFETLKSERYSKYFGSQTFGISHAQEVLRGNQQFWGNLASFSAKASGDIVGGMIEKLGEGAGWEEMERLGAGMKAVGEGVAREIDEDTQKILEESLPGLEQTRFKDTFAGNVGSAVLQETLPMVAQISITGGSSFAMKQVGASAMKKSVSELAGKGALKFVDNIAAPFIGSLTGGARSAVNGWLDAQKTAESILGEYDSVEAAREAGDDEVADKADKILWDADKVFYGNLATTTGSDLLMMRHYLGRAGGTIGARTESNIVRAIGNKGLEALKSSVGEAYQEVGQGIMERGWAKSFIDENRELFDKEDIALDAAAGLIMGFAADFALGRGGPQDAKDQQVKEFADRALERDRQTLKRGEELREARQENEAEIARLSKERPESMIHIGAQTKMDAEVGRLAETMVESANLDTVLSQDESSSMDDAAIVRADMVLSKDDVSRAHKRLEQNNPRMVEVEMAKVERDFAPPEQAKGVVKDRESGKYKVKNKLTGKNELFPEVEQANHFARLQNRRKKTESLKTAAKEARDEGKKQAMDRRQNKRDAEKAIKEAESERKKNLSEAKKAVSEKRSSLLARRREISGRAKDAPKNMRESSKKGDARSFFHSSMDYLLGKSNESGLSVLVNAFGSKTNQFIDWATDLGRRKLNDEASYDKILKGTRKFNDTGKAPLDGMENEFSSLTRLMEPLYRRMARDEISSAKEDSEAGEAAREKLRDFNTLFVDDIRRGSMSELKAGEVAAKREGFVRVPTKKGLPQSGFTERVFAASFMKRLTDPQGQRMRIEEDGGLFYVVKPLLTPEVSRNLNLTDRIHNLEFDPVENAKAQDPPPYEAVKQRAEQRGGISFAQLERTARRLLSGVPVLGPSHVNPELDLVMTLAEDMGIASKQTDADVRMWKNDLALNEDGSIVNVVPKEEGMPIHWHSVMESVAKGEDNYTMPDTVRTSLLNFRSIVRQLVHISAQEGVDMSFIDPTLSDSSTFVDIEKAGIEGYIPMVADMAATAEKARREGRDHSPEAMANLFKKARTVRKGSYEKKRKLDSADQGVELGIVWKDPMHTLLDFSTSIRQNIALARFQKAHSQYGGIDATADSQSEKKSGRSVKFNSKSAAHAFERVMSHLQPDSTGWRIAKEITSQLKTVKVGFDIGYLSIYGAPLAANSMEAFIGATYESMMAVANKEGSYDRHIRNTDVAIKMQDAAKHGVPISTDIEFLVGQEKGVWADAPFALATKWMTLGKYQARPFHKLAEGMRVYRLHGAMSLWEGMTASLPKDQFGNILPEASEEALAIGEHISATLGSYDFRAGGFSKGVENAFNVISFAPQMYMAFTSTLVKAKSRKDSNGPRARKALANLAIGYYSLSIAGMIAAGLSWEEIKKRINPFTAGSKFLSVPITYPNGKTAEVNLGGYFLAFAKMLSRMGRSAASYVDYLPEEYKSDENLQDAPLAFVDARKSPLLSTTYSLLSGRNFFGEPIPRAETFIEAVFPLPVDSAGKVLAQRFGQYIKPEHGGGINSAIGRPDEIFIDKEILMSMRVSEVVAHILGTNLYFADERKNFAAALDKKAMEMYGSTYGDLATPEEGARVSDAVSNSPEWKERRLRAFRNKQQMNRVMKGYSKNNWNNTQYVLNQLSKSNRTEVERAQFRFPSIPNTYNKLGEDIVLEPSQKRRLRKVFASYLDSEISELRLSPSYISASDSYKMEAVRKKTGIALKRALVSEAWWSK